jgi:nucleotide-binding universal stress UspA family protein
MIRIAQVLCPVDFSPISSRALNHATALAQWYEATLTVLNVFPVMPVMDVPPLVLDDKLRHELTCELRRFTELVPPGVRLELRVEQADLVDEAIREHATRGVDLLVMGSHGRSGFKRLLLGSVTERVIRHTSCPTMIVPPHAHDVVPEGPVRYGTILCAVDFSEPSIRAVEYALNLAEESDADLRLLHVLLPVSAEMKELASSFEELRLQIEGDRLRRLGDLIPDDATTYCTVHTALRQGAVHREILAAAAEQPADLIVMGARGRGALDAAIFGSNTARVARAAGCPVLVVH